MMNRVGYGATFSKCVLEVTIRHGLVLSHVNLVSEPRFMVSWEYTTPCQVKPLLCM